MESGNGPFIGIDVSQLSLDIAWADECGGLKLPYTASAVRQWLRSLPEACFIGVESTGDLHRRVVRLAIAAGHRVYVLNARDLSHYARSPGAARQDGSAGCGAACSLLG